MLRLYCFKALPEKMAQLVQQVLTALTDQMALKAYRESKALLV